MDDYVIAGMGFWGSVAGGALGTRFAGAPASKGALTAGLAVLAQLLIGEIVDVQHWLVGSLIFVLAVGLIGGRWGLRLTALQLSLVVIGSFLVSLVASAVILYLAVSTGRV